MIYDASLNCVRDGYNFGCHTVLLFKGVRTVESRGTVERRGFSAFPALKDDRYLPPFFHIFFHFSSRFFVIRWSFFALFSFSRVPLFVVRLACIVFIVRFWYWLSVVHFGSIVFPIFFISLFVRLVRAAVGAIPRLRLISPSPSPCFFIIALHCHFFFGLFHGHLPFPVVHYPLLIFHNSFFSFFRFFSSFG